MDARPVVVRPERPDRHLGAEVRAADPDVDHVRERLAVPRAVPPGADLLGEDEEPLPHRLDFRPDRGPVDGDVRIRAVPKGHVEGRPAFRRIHPPAGEEIIAPGR